MIEKLIQTTLEPVIEAEKRLKQRRVRIVMLSIGAVALGIFTLLASRYNWWSLPTIFGVLGSLFAITLIALYRVKKNTLNARQIARKIEENHPDLRSALLAAMDQKPGPDGELSYLQKRLLGEVSEHATANQWVKKVSGKKLGWALVGQLAALAAFFVMAQLLIENTPENDPFDPIAGTTGPETPETPEFSVNVTPGSIEIERGSRLVVEADFFEQAPALAMLEITPKDKPETGRRIPMQRGLDDTVFSALIPEVSADSNYQITFADSASATYEITTFEYPVLEQADAHITPPAYLNEEAETVTDTMKITVMEGSKVDWSLRVNKPVEAAELFSEEGDSIELRASADDPTLLTATMTPTDTTKYRVHLVDKDSRANVRPPWIKVNVTRNLPPKLKFTFPGQDFKVTSLQEFPIEGEVWDDVGVKRAGLTFQINGEDTDRVLTDEELPGKKNHPLASQVDLETIKKLEPRQLIAYHFWAEDLDHNGELRRTTSDQFFAEVRFFEDIMREGQPQSGEPGQNSQTLEALKLQKEVVNATWKLMRDHDYKKPFSVLKSDIAVVRDSQLVVHSTVGENLQEVDDPKLREILTAAQDIMMENVKKIAMIFTKEDGGMLSESHVIALRALAKLTEASNREIEVSTSRGQGNGEKQEQQIMNLELEQKELKYEEESKAEQATQSAEQKENIEVLTRLKELARRQEAIAEKIKELEKELQDANEEEKAEIERQLKRLQEEQEELLRELDDLGERMESEQNRPNMTEEKEELDKTRENVQEASEKLEEGKLADAANAATRAQEQLEEMKEEFRERTSRRFSKEMEAVRNAARELDTEQRSISEELDELVEQSDDNTRSEDNQEQRGELARRMSRQERALDELLEEMKQLSEQSEVSEPLLSDALYESVREATTSGAQESLQEARQYTYYDRAEQAKPAAAAATRGIEDLRKAVEAAAEKVLGNEADALRMARSELDDLIQQTEDEKKRLAGEKAGEEAGSSGGDKEKEKDKEKGAGEKPGELAGSDGEEGEGKEPGQGEGKKPGQGSGEGEELAEAGKGKGEKGKGPGKGQSEPGQAGEPTGSGQGQGEGQQGQAGSPTGSGQGEQPGEQGKGGKGGKGGSEPGSESLAESSGRSGGGEGGGVEGNTDGHRPGVPTRGLFFNQKSEEKAPGPITGEDYGDWADRLSRIEEMLPQADLRNNLAQVQDDARAMRIDFRRDNAAPEAATIQKRITDPLIELRQRITEELAKMNRENPIAPIDRDAVPSEFRDLVRRYYEELGAGK
ncbi:hypothetical protein VSU19_08155 [Verrucomicrobiales bacterium BCK34]|nr:hypothetical protein [Verrucomicrobiales bacterium BCK34]